VEAGSERAVRGAPSRAEPEEALDLADDTSFGLSASVFTNDFNRAMRYLHGMQAGVIKVNQETGGLKFQVPFGGMGDSPSGRSRTGDDGLVGSSSYAYERSERPFLSDEVA
jgi:acyl-CoA reductase-like NAD-dependent aldehyde dehydrogenase